MTASTCSVRAPQCKVQYRWRATSRSTLPPVTLVPLGEDVFAYLRPTTTSAVGRGPGQGPAHRTSTMDTYRDRPRPNSASVPSRPGVAPPKVSDPGPVRPSAVA